MEELDNTDREILQTLRSNCRVSYQHLAKLCDLSAPAIRSRVLNLEMSGIITNYVIYYSLAMVKAFAVLIEVYTNGSEVVEEFIESIGMDPLISDICWSGQEKYILLGYYTCIEEAARLTEYVRSNKSVISVKVYTLLCPRGQSTLLTRNQQRIYRALAENPRSSSLEIASRTGFSTKTVRRAISSVNGSILHFTLNWNPSAGKNIGFIVKLQLKESLRINEIDERLLALPISNKVWETYRCATKPVYFVLFASSTMAGFNEILCITRTIMDITKLSSTICASWHSFPNFRLLSHSNANVSFQE